MVIRKFYSNQKAMTKVATNELVVKAFAVTLSCRAESAAQLVVTGNLEPLRGWDGLVLKSVGVTTAQDTNALHGEEIVSSVRMVVNTTEEGSSGVLANHLDEQVWSTRVFLDEAGNVMNETRDEDEGASLGLFLERVPADDGEIVAVAGPYQSLLSFTKLLQLHGELTLPDFILGEDLQVAGETEEVAALDKPLGGVVLVPPDGVPVVHGELVVEVVVTFTKSAEGSDDMITRSVLVIERCFTEPVGEGVDAEGGVVDEAETEDTSIDEATLGVAPEEPGNKSGDNETHQENEFNVVPVLPPNDLVLAQVRDVSNTGLSPRLDHHPANVRPVKATVSVVGVEVGVGVPMVSTVSTAPPLDRAFNCTRTSEGKEIFKGLGGVVGTVRP